MLSVLHSTQHRGDQSREKHMLKHFFAGCLFLCAMPLAGATTLALSPQQLVERSALALRDKTGAGSVSIAVLAKGKIFSGHFGELDMGANHPRSRANDASLFEIGSVSKVFVGTVVAQAIVDGKLALDDDIRKHLAGDYPHLQFEGQPIRIKHLLTHKTGIDTPFPDTRQIRLNYPPEDFIVRKNMLDARYTKSDFFKELAAARVTAAPGTRFKYGALGPELCAAILEKVYGESYDALLQRIVLAPAGMTATRLRLTPEQRLATGYNATGRRMDALSSNLWGASKFLKSTMGDLLSFVTFELASRNPAVLESQRVIDPEGAMAYFWETEKNATGGWNYVKDGGSNGTSSIVKILPSQQMGIVIIVNQSDMSTGIEVSAALAALEKELLAPAAVKTVANSYPYPNEP